MVLMGMLKSSQVLNQNFINKQTNYVQINGIELTEEKIKSLNKEQLMQIEGILKNDTQLSDVMLKQVQHDSAQTGNSHPELVSGSHLSAQPNL